MRAINYIWLSAVALLATLSAAAKEVRDIEPAILEVIYLKKTVTDTLDREADFHTTYMALRAGRTASMFFSVPHMQEDTMQYYHPKLYWERERIAAEQRRLTGAERPRLFPLFTSEVIYKNIPAGKVQVNNLFGLTHWTYTEPWEKPQWTLLPDTDEVMGYQCQMAVCHYRGRRWTAWFTLDIPLPEGPWKLCGLPGLILKARDHRGDYEFTAESIRTDGLQPVQLCDFTLHGYSRTDRDTYYREWSEALHEDIGYQMMKAGAFGLDPKDAPSAPRKMPHRNYDFEETDYH